MLEPTPKPFAIVTGLVGVAILPLPAIKVHKPVPTAGVLPFNGDENAAQTLVEIPALATVGLAKLVMLTVELLGEHTPLLMVHANTFVPTPNPVTALLGLVGVVMAPKPDTSVQLPLPTAGVLPEKLVAVVAHKLKLVPALETVGIS